MQPKEPDAGQGSSNVSFESLAHKFSINWGKTSAAVNTNLAEKVKSLLAKQLTKEKVREV